MVTASGSFVIVNWGKRIGLVYLKGLMEEGHFLHMLFLENEEQPSKKNFRAMFFKVKWSPHAKIQCFLNTFKTAKKNLGTFLHASFLLYAWINTSNFYPVLLIRWTPLFVRYNTEAWQKLSHILSISNQINFLCNVE